MANFFANLLRAVLGGRVESDLEIARHHQLATAIPFPSLDWKPDAREGSLVKLYDFADTFAQSAIDWYINERQEKKRLATIFQRLTMFFSILGAVVLLPKVFSPTVEAAIVSTLFDIKSDLSGFSAEASLVCFGIATAFNFADRLAGASAGWIRCITTAMQLDQMLLEFRLSWNALEMRKRYRGDSAVPEAAPSTSPGDVAAAPARTIEDEQFALIRLFCQDVSRKLDTETSGWAEEFTKSKAEFEEHQQLGVFRRPRRTGQ
jgi:hypothetical protein